jgi:hypothetical protein
MKCPKCGYASFAYLESCHKCGQGLAKQQAVFGLYALRPDPPSLLMAYQAAQMDADDTRLETPVLPSPAIDLSHLEEIELDLSATEETSPITEMVEGQAGSPVDLTPTIQFDSAPELEPLGSEPDTEETNPSAGGIPSTFDLNQLGDISLELEPAVDVGDSGTGLDTRQTPPASPEERQVYDLDLEEERDGLTLDPQVNESHVDQSEEGQEEYVLEIEDEIELEIDELALDEDDDESEEEDDNDR